MAAGAARVPAKHLVVARFNENTQWLRHLPEWKPLVVQKGQHLPNEGREVSSFLWGITKLYDKLQPDDLVACVQGSPGEHCPQIVDELRLPVNGFRELGQWRVVCDQTGSPHHPGLPMAECFRDWFGGEPPELFEFLAGGQFVVTGEAVRSRPKSFYEGLIPLMSVGEAPWVMERLWWFVFNKESVVGGR